MRFGLLGPLVGIDDDGLPIDLGGRQPRTLLAMLVVAAGRAVPVDAITEAIWGDDLPASAMGTLQSYVSRLRRRIGDAAPLHWDDAGYRLDVPADRVDFRRFERLDTDAVALLAKGEPHAAIAVWTEAESLWRGPALVEFLDHDFAIGVAARLEEQRLTAVEQRMAAELQVGNHAAVVGELAALVAAHPLRETLQGRLALALYRSGRQAEALRSLAEAGRTLRDEFGIEPSRPLRELEGAILRHDASLDLPPRDTPASATDAQRSPARPSPTRPPSSLVGRTAEMAMLQQALDESADSARFVVIEGEPGIGKTRLAEELRAVAVRSGARTVWGRTDEGGAAPALWPWLDPLRELAALVDDVDPTLAELLVGTSPLAPGRALDIQFERFSAVADLLARVATSRPVVVVLDDVQWADAASLELLRFLSTRLRGGVLVALTLRQLEVGRNDAVTETLAAIARRPGSRRIHLRGLDASATAAMLDVTTTRSPSPSVAAEIHARAEGNPFFAIELARLLDEEADARAAVPAGVGDVIRRRLARLPDATVELLGIAAVTGRDVELGLLTRTAGSALEDCLDTLEPAVVHRLLIVVPDRPSVFRFNHALVREVLLDDLSALRRARLHLRVADAIEATGAGIDVAEILAEHLWRAAPVGGGARAAEALERAADVAVRRVAYEAAEDLLQRSVQLRRTTASTPAEHEAELGAILRLLEVKRARVYFQAAADRTLIERAKELAQSCGREDALHDLLWFEFASYATAARGAEAGSIARAYLQLAGETPRTLAQAIGNEVWAVHLWGEGRITESATHLDRAVALLEQAPVHHVGFEPEQRLVTRMFWLMVHGMHGDATPEQTFAGFDELIAATPDRVAIASICGFAATAGLVLGCWPEVERFAAINMHSDPEAQFAFWGGQALMQQGIVRVRNGDLAGGRSSFARGVERYSEIGARSALPSTIASFAIELVRQGALAEAAEQLRDAQAWLDSHGERWNEPVVHIAEAMLADAEGDRDRAATTLQLAADVATAQGSHALARRAAAIAAELGV